MNLDEIPTPESDDCYHKCVLTPGPGNGLVMRSKMRDLERRLTIEKNRANEMGKLAHKNACEAMEYRRLLTVAREALEGVSKNAQPSGPFWHGGEIQTKVCEALTITAPKQCT